MTLPKFSPKRLKAIEDGTYKPKPRKPLKRKALTVKEGRELLRRALPSKGDRSKAMRKADKWFSEYIRLRDADDYGYITCVTSGRRMHWRKADCGHFISRAKMCTRYEERNCHAQSKIHNQFQGGHFLEHGIAIDRIHGKGTRKELETKAVMTCKMTTEDFLHIADKYQKRVEFIRKMFPVKYRSV